MRIRMMLSALALLAVGAVRMHAQSHPNFAGTWSLDPAKTVAEGQGAAPESATRVIVQHGDTLTVDTESMTAGNAQKTHLVWGTDGKPWKNTVMVAGENAEVSSVLAWDGATLVVRTSLSVQGMSVEQIDRWTLSADGKTLTAVRGITADGNDIGTVTLTYIKKS